MLTVRADGILPFAANDSGEGPRAGRANPHLVLLTLAVVAVLLLSLIGFAAVAWVARAAMERLGLDPWKVLLWFGLAEAPVDELAVRRGAPARTSVRAAPSASR